MHNTRRGAETLNAMARVVSERLGGGWLRLYAGIRPADPDTLPDPERGQVLLAQLRFSDPAFGSPRRGVIVATPFAEFEREAPATGTASWFRATAPGGETVLEGTVGASDAALILDDPKIPRGAEVVITRFSYAVEA